MKIEKVINNNVVSALENGREVVVMGRGIGFQLRAGMDIPGELIEKVFRLDNPGVMDQFKSLVQKLPPERLQISAEVIQYAKGVMNKKLNHNIYLTLTDHINFAIERYQKKMLFSNPLLAGGADLLPGGIPDRHVCAGLDRAKAGNYISGR